MKVPYRPTGPSIFATVFLALIVLFPSGVAAQGLQEREALSVSIGIVESLEMRGAEAVLILNPNRDWFGEVRVLLSIEREALDVELLSDALAAVFPVLDRVGERLADEGPQVFTVKRRSPKENHARTSRESADLERAAFLLDGIKMNMARIAEQRRSLGLPESRGSDQAEVWHSEFQGDRLVGLVYTTVRREGRR